VIDSAEPARDLMPYETGRLPDQPGRDAESALESAARHLRAVPRPIGTNAAREREVLRGRQTRDLLAWARENNCLTEFAEYSGLAIRGGEEHRVWLSPDGSSVLKATYAGAFGYSIICSEATGGLPEITKGLPLEYLERLLLQNRIFGDDIRLKGVAEESDGAIILSSQPLVAGFPVDREEFIPFMQRLWFEPLLGLSLGNPGALAFYRDLDEVAAFDAHPANFVKDFNGVILPIDLILVRTDSALQAALTRYLS
jgi:hypothetical protein